MYTRIRETSMGRQSRRPRIFHKGKYPFLNQPEDLYLANSPKICNILETIYGPIIFVAKSSVIFQLQRIFCTGQRRNGIYWLFQTLNAATFGYYFSCLWTFIFQCWPREKIWNPDVEGRCIDAKAATLAAGIFNLISDLGILLLPIWATWHLQMPLKRKLAVAAVFGTGIL
jgi:hypothetical protein